MKKLDLEQESIRLDNLNIYENTIYKSDKNIKFIAGIDEVGRGPLAGPVYACAVILKPNTHILRVNDSKKLSPKLREALDHQIRAEAIDFAIGIIDQDTIDEINIYQATCLAMKQAVNNLKIKPDFILTDAIRIRNIDIRYQNIVKGDTLSISIAAASIIAKVARDRFMIEMHYRYPVYNFINNKGYGTKEHIMAIKKYGICPLHRRSFLRKIF